jgi:hypothetical protein
MGLNPFCQLIHTMRVYINNDTIDISKITSSCILQNSRNIYEVFSRDGLFLVEEDNVYRLNVSDGDIINSDNFTIDKSSIERIKTTTLPYDHFSIPKKQTSYKFKTTQKLKTPILFVVEQTMDDKITDCYFDSYSEEFNVFL